MTITLITGANKGLGYEAARRLIATGHTVDLGARDIERGILAAETIGATFVPLDVTDLNGNAGTQTVTESTDAMVHLATIGPDGPTGGFFDRNGTVPW